MGSVASVNPGIATVLKTLSNSGSSALSSALASPTVQSVLQNAPPADIAQLSSQALQLQEMDTLFGAPTESANPSLLSSLFPSSSSSSPASLLQSLDASLLASTTVNPATAAADPAGAQASVSAQLATYQAVLQAAQVQALFGTATTNPAVNLLA
ncbi:MAG: hypothetical protein LAP40_14680 [Acidobacteriia bacterium]|nr:hypothetical protein [Terriglobia bacterium]